MNDWALFINGIYRSVLDEILSTQSHDPEITLFLQPYGGKAIARLRDNVPSPEVSGDTICVHDRRVENCQLHVRH